MSRFGWMAALFFAALLGGCAATSADYSPYGHDYFRNHHSEGGADG